MAAKSLGFGVYVYSDLWGNTELAGKQMWGADINVEHRKIVYKYQYNHFHDT